MSVGLGVKTPFAIFLLALLIAGSHGQASSSSSTVVSSGVVSIQSSSSELVNQTSSAIAAIEADPSDLDAALQSFMNALAQSLLNILSQLFQQGSTINASEQASQIAQIVGEALQQIASNSTGQLASIDVSGIQTEVETSVQTALAEADGEAASSGVIQNALQSALDVVGNGIASALGLQFASSVELGAQQTVTTTQSGSASASASIGSEATTATTTQTANASFEISGTSSAELQSQLVDATSSAIAAIEANPDDLNSALTNLLAAIANSLGNILITIVQGGTLDAETQSDQISIVIGNALQAIVSSATGPLATLDVAKVQSDIKANVSAIINQAGANAEVTSVIEQIGQGVLSIVGQEIASVLGLSNFSSSISFEFQQQSQTSTIGIQPVTVNVAGQGGVILNLLLAGNITSAKSTLESMLLQGGQSQLVDIFNAAYGDENLRNLLINLLVSVYQDADFNALPLSVAYGGVYSANSSGLIDIMSEVLIEIAKQEQPAVGLSQALSFAFTSQTGGVRETFQKGLETAIATVGCEEIGPILLDTVQEAGAMDTLLIIQWQQIPEFMSCLQVGYQLQISLSILSQLDNPSSAAESISTSLSAGNTSTVQDILVKGATQNFTNLVSTLSILFGQSGIDYNSFNLAFGAALNGSESEQVTSAVSQSLEDASKSLTVNLTLLVNFLNEGLTNEATQKEYVKVIKGSFEGDACGLSNVVDQVADQAVQTNDQAVLGLIKNDTELQNCVTPETLIKIIPAPPSPPPQSPPPSPSPPSPPSPAPPTPAPVATAIAGSVEVNISSPPPPTPPTPTPTPTPTPVVVPVVVPVPAPSPEEQVDLEESSPPPPSPIISSPPVSPSPPPPTIASPPPPVVAIAQQIPESPSPPPPSPSPPSPTPTPIPAVTPTPTPTPTPSPVPVPSPTPSPTLAPAVVPSLAPMAPSPIAPLPMAPSPIAPSPMALSPMPSPLMPTPTPTPTPIPSATPSPVAEPDLDELPSPEMIPLPAPVLPSPSPMMSPPPMSPPPNSPPPPSPIQKSPLPEPAKCAGRAELLVELASGKQYTFGHRMTYEDAAEVCDCLGGTLVIVNDASEQLLVGASHELKRMHLALLGEANAYYRFWMGLSNPSGVRKADSWVWADDTKISYTAWRWDEPTYLANGTIPENCALIDAHYTECDGVKVRKYIAWEDDSCYIQHSFMCERENSFRLQNTPTQIEFLYVAVLDRVYVLLKDKTYSFSSAKKECEFMGGQMVIFRNRVEEDMVYGALATVLPEFTTAPVWIGLEREDSECGISCGCPCNGKAGCDCDCGGDCEEQMGDFMWVSGRPLGNYVNWMGQPCGSVMEECLPEGQCVLTWVQKTPDTITGAWTPVEDCGMLAHAICEIQGVYYH